MTTVQSDKVKTVTFHGGGDDLDKPIKDVRNDTQFQSMFLPKLTSFDRFFRKFSNVWYQ